MLFNSPEFAVFFAIVYSTYWLMRGSYRSQNSMLLLASYVFYGWWDVRFLFLIVMTTSADFCYGLMIGKGSLEWRQRLAVSLLMVSSAFVFVTIRWSAVQFSPPSRGFQMTIDWRQALPSHFHEWWVVLATIVVVVALNVGYPKFLTLCENRRRNIFLVASLVTNLGTLAFFKYFNFFAESLREVVQTLFNVTPSAWTLNIVLPVGISFFTFQSLSYTIDVYHRRIPPETDLGILLTCMAFFPQLVAGPIERASHLLPQFHRPRSVTEIQWRTGIWLIVWGLFQKLVVADNAAVIVNSVFGQFDSGPPFPPIPKDGLRILIGVYAFALQIFGDFSGYSDIARGTARLLGFDVMLNFNLPYFAMNPSEFWRRWHISLSTWLRDYLYIPLGGSRAGTAVTYRNLFLTMLLGGLWHGAAWTYVLWGMFHGTLLIAYQALLPWLGGRTKTSDSSARSSMIATVGQVWAGVIMFHLTCLGWLLFRAQNITTVTVFVQAMFFHPHWSPETTRLAISLLSCSWFFIVFQLIQAWHGTTEPIAHLPGFVRLNTWAFVVMSLLTLSADSERTFIYFAF